MGIVALLSGPVQLWLGLSDQRPWALPLLIREAVLQGRKIPAVKPL